MAEFDTVIRNAVVVTAADVVEADLGIAGGVVTALGRGLGPARREIDAAGRYVMPGGIDTHCHFDQPMRDSVTLADDFLSGTVSAAHGGTTTVVPFACQLQGQSLRDAVDDYHRRAAGKPVIDYAFHLIISDPTEAALRDELPALIREGYSSFKIYMTYETLKLSDRQIIAVLAVARREGAMVMVHAENSDCIAWLTEELERQGKTAPYFHAVSRRRRWSARAPTARSPCPRSWARPSCSSTSRARTRSSRSAGPTGAASASWPRPAPSTSSSPPSTCTRPGSRAPSTSAARPRATRRASGRCGTASPPASSRCSPPTTRPSASTIRPGKKRHGDRASFTQVPNGIPGVETRMPLLFSEGVGKGRIDLTRSWR